MHGDPTPEVDMDRDLQTLAVPYGALLIWAAWETWAGDHFSQAAL